MAITTGSAALAACAPRLSRAIADATFTPSPDLPVATFDVTKHPIRSTPAIQSTPEKWHLSLSQRAELMARPEFFTEPLGNNTTRIITPQFSDRQYTSEKRKILRNNTCIAAVIASSGKIPAFLDTSIVPNTTIADVYNVLDGLYFIDTKGRKSKFVDWDDQMYFGGIPDALSLVFPKSLLKTEFLTPNHGSRYSRIVPQVNWPDALSKAQTVCKNGGWIALRGLKKDDAAAAHVLLATGVKNDGLGTFVDSYDGTAKRGLLKDIFASGVDPDAKFLGEQPGLLDMIGITPK